MRPDENCELCACKHLARAKGLLCETRLGHEESFWFALGEISLAEEHLLKDHEDLAREIREERKALELNPRYDFPYKELILRVSGAGGYSITSLCDSDGFISGENL